MVVGDWLVCGWVVVCGRQVVFCEWSGRRPWATLSVRVVWAVVGGFGPWLLVGSFLAGWASVRGRRLSFWAAEPSFGAAVSSFVARVVVGVPHRPVVFKGDWPSSPVIV
jgi:hypothetical protein